MPDLDGGHLFLTVLAPVRTDAMLDPIVGRSRSHGHMLAQKLALIPTGRQTAASAPDGWASPFSRNTMNHLARFAIIDGPAFNGRVSEDTLVGLLKGTDPLVAQPVDALTNPFLLFAADVDAQGLTDVGPAVRAYTDALWATMKDDLVVIFGHCVGFEGVADADGFFAYVRRCQVETTMPFNDYWLDGLPLPPDKPGGGAAGIVKPAAYALCALAAVWLAAVLIDVVSVALGFHGDLPRLASRLAVWGVILGLAVVVVVGIVAWIAYRWVMAKGAKPLPTAPGADLPTVLKALFLQQQFTRFAIEAQGLDDAALHARFGRFLAAVEPAAPQPTQGAGEVKSDRVEWTS